MADRTVEIWRDENFDDALRMAGVTYKERDAAIGYLTNWSMGSTNKAHVAIDCRASGEIIATYWDSRLKSAVTYEIGAVLSEDGTYSFHS